MHTLASTLDAFYTVSEKTTLLWLATPSTYINQVFYSFWRNVAKNVRSQMVLYFPLLLNASALPGETESSKLRLFT